MTPLVPLALGAMPRLAARRRSGLGRWGGRLLMGGVYLVVAIAAFSLVVTLYRLIAGALAGR